MAAPLKSSKSTVNLASGEVKVSRIRRDPPPKPVREMTLRERNERDMRIAIVGILAFAVGTFAILLAISHFTGWSPRDVVIRIEQ